MNTVPLITAIIATTLLFLLNTITCIVVLKEGRDDATGGLAFINSLILLSLLMLLIALLFT